jgi:antitoxin (DNA-binding transcriptional repressor) of toxin-antitoxin stability system
MTATEASRNFSDLLDAIERGETVTITRGNHAVAEIAQARRRTGADLHAALADIPPPDRNTRRAAADPLSATTAPWGLGVAPRQAWWGGRDSNPRPRDYESPALTH